MTAKIYSFGTQKKIPVTDEDIFYEVFEQVLIDWQKYAAQNKLNDYIKSKIPAHTRGSESADYTGDLNVLSVVEQKLDMRLSIKWPASTLQNLIGWVAGFSYSDRVFYAPIEMSSEAYARAMCIVLYVTFWNKIKIQNKEK